ncbi:hypothetical protein FISHEDRAFT_36944 [Fistulina hepatica ATCC 64428]|uniref:Nucleolar protein 12 n=1 Tax=Fistulina hepatica ATCC 64428 TaxID=1128425 RepID=A0A0D7AIE2_9AGAR|nr:hypothetical protein FISHEDRAFT_36944 [Fistulina hepatica ATCC 64428]
MRQKAAPFVPADETPAMREARTIFIGNISVDVPQKKSSVNQLRRHILAHVPTAKIESMRFRSVPFQKPTTKVEDDDSKAAKGSASRDHDRERASSWRKAHEAAEENTKGETKQYLTPQQKKKVAFINHEFNTSADTVHAYIVFAHPPPPDVSTKRPANLPPLPPTMDPYEAACAAAEACDGTMFLERVIRVDVVGALDGVGASTHHADPKLSVFVGNLDFETREREVRSFFEGVLSAARGPPPIVEEGETSAAKPKTWVTRVRLVRDRDTQLGKGFAYVQFADTTCVDEILAKEPGTLKLAKRKLRVQRCRKTSSVSAKSAKAAVAASSARPSVKFPPSAAVPAVRKGDPTLGTKLANMSKEARKEYKAADADRVARRLAKKKARNTLAVRPEGKDRDRVRKSVLQKGKRSAAPEKKKTRVRSEKSLANRNRKK